MNNIRVMPLSERPEFAPACAKFSFDEWGWHPVNSSLENSISLYEERAKNTNKIPLAWVGIQGQTIVGMVNLVEHDHEDYTHLSPWLAGMYVAPEFRGNGYAAQLIQRLHQGAQEIGHKHLYLFTPNAKTLYEKNGWKITKTVCDAEEEHYNGHLMEIDLPN